MSILMQLPHLKKEEKTHNKHHTHKNINQGFAQFWLINNVIL